ncbi:unnamed protein product [Peniophora sp. CBMAI 1063]|nr:unnamed protein product [Peniophora sp. CBMAI 1063]
MAIVLASQDRYSGNSSWQEQVDNNTLLFYESGRAGLGSQIDNVDIAAFGVAEVAAGLAYNSSQDHRLSIAEFNYNIINEDFITDGAAQNASYPRPLNTTCGSTLGGLLFASHSNTTNLTVHADAIGAWVVLTARLYELTQKPTYLAAAEQSIRFMEKYMINVNDSNSVVSSTFDPTTCTVNTTDLGTASADSVGYFIEGLSIVANVTANETYTHMLDVLIPAVVSYRNWHNSDGVLTEDTVWSSKGTLIRGLLEARLRNPSNEELINLFNSYITVQYNAVRNNAFIGGNDYAVSWHGGSSVSGQYNTVGNVEALDVLNAAFVIAPPDASPTQNANATTTGAPANSTTTAPSSSSSRTASTRVGTIVGATVGSTVAAALAVLALFLYLRRRRRAREMPVNDDLDDDEDSGNAARKRSARDPALEPFSLVTPIFDRTRMVSEKGRSQQRVTLGQEFYGSNNSSSTPTSPEDHPSEVSPITPAVSSDSDALHALERRLERRLDNLIQTLVVHGDTESNPPEYDGHYVHRA